MLRFAGRIVSDRPEDHDRRFTISYFLADDSMLVFEPPQRYVLLCGVCGVRSAVCGVVWCAVCSVRMFSTNRSTHVVSAMQ